MFDSKKGYCTVAPNAETILNELLVIQESQKRIEEKLGLIDGRTEQLNNRLIEILHRLNQISAHFPPNPSVHYGAGGGGGESGRCVSYGGIMIILPKPPAPPKPPEMHELFEQYMKEGRQEKLYIYRYARFPTARHLMRFTPPYFQMHTDLYDQPAFLKLLQDLPEACIISTGGDTHEKLQG